MRRNKRQTTKMSLLMLILLLGIGFAALTANLKINGTLNVSRTSWDVHFENVSITEGSVEANPAPTSDDTTTTEMTYTINFTKPGDYFEFTTDIVNEGTIDAMVDTVSNKVYSSDGTTEVTLPSYLKSTVAYLYEYKDDHHTFPIQIQKNDFLGHGTSEKVRVRVEFRQDIDPSDLPSSGDTALLFKFNANYKQADENVNYEILSKIYKKEATNEVCIYNKNFSSEELCLSDGDAETSTQKIKDYFGFDENTWEMRSEEGEDDLGYYYHNDIWTTSSNELLGCTKNYVAEKFMCSYGTYAEDRIFVYPEIYDSGRARAVIFLKSSDGSRRKDVISTN